MHAIAFALIWGVMLTGVSTADVAAPTVVRIDNPDPQAEAQFGRSVEGIGDINGDGVGDLAVGAPPVDLVYLLSGADQSIIHTIGDPDGLSDFLFGWAIRGVGDIDGDGIEDMVVGAPDLWGTGAGLPIQDPECIIDPSLCPEEVPHQGRAFVFSGATGNLILRLIPESGDYYKLGAAVAPLGDVNGDGIPDVAIGAPFLFANLGRVFALSGADGSQLWKTVEPPPGPGYQSQSIASFGYYMKEVGDLTGDGRSDLLVAAPYHDCDPDPDDYLLAGRGYVLDGFDGTIFRTHNNPNPDAEGFLGGGPGAIGDQNGDGIEDYAFGDADAGAVYLFSGASGTIIRQIESPGDGSTDFFGFKIARMDDKDGDGLDDFWVAAPKGGTVYLMNSMGDVLVQVDDPNPVAPGMEGGFGWSISATEDLDGDGGLDLIIGKSVESVGGFGGAGAVYLVLGVHWVPEPDISVSPGSLSFGDVEVGNSKFKFLHISNNGNVNLIIGPITISGPDGGEFHQALTLISISPHSTHSTLVYFSPTSAGSKSATLELSSNDPDTPTLNVPLGGTGVAIPGDLDGDGQVCRTDLNIILAARNTPADGLDDPRDLDGDGMITALDARKLVLLCTRPRCACEEPPD